MLAGVHLDDVARVAGAGRHRERALVVAQLGAVVGEGDLRRDHLLLVVGRRLGAEHGQEDRPRVPVDVEVRRVARRPTVHEDVRPPRVVLRHVHADVVRHDVEQEPQPALADGRDEGAPALLAAALVGDPGGVDHVVAVVAALARRQQGRGVDGADPQRVEVGHQLRTVAEGRVGRELDPVGRGGDHSAAVSVRCSTRTERAGTVRADPPPTVGGVAATTPGTVVSVVTSPAAVSTTIAHAVP